MSTVLDETHADVPVRDLMVNLHRLPAAPADPSAGHAARTRLDVSRVSREELEDRFLRQHEETLLLKQQIHNQEDKIRKLGTKLMRLVKDRGRMEQLASGRASSASRVRDVEMEEMMEQLQEKVRALQVEKEGLKQRLLVAKQQLVTSQRTTPYGHVQPRVNSGLKKLQNDDASPKSGRPPPGQLPRYGHSLLEEARAEVRNLENVVESQRSHMEELESVSELLREELRSKEAEHEENLLQLRQQHSSKLRSQVSSNVSLIKLQKQLADRSHTVSELEARYLHLQQSQQLVKASHEAAMAKVDELSAQLKDERTRSLQLEKDLQICGISRVRAEQLQERVGELEQERDLLKDENQKLVNRALDVSQQQRQQLQEQQLRLQVSQLEAALQADLLDKNQILDRIKAERDSNEKLTEENQKLQVQCAEQKQQVAQLSARLQLYGKESEHDVAELTEALLHIKERNSQRSGQLGFLKQEEEQQEEELSTRRLRAALAETIQELEKTRNLLSVESRISRDYKAELNATVHKMHNEKSEYEQKLERQAHQLEAKNARIRKLEAQLRDLAYGSKTSAVRPDVLTEDEDLEDTVLLQPGESLVELQIVGAVLSPPALQVLGDSDADISTFCTYCFYLFEPHGTPVAAGAEPRYGFTSRFVVTEDERFLDYLRRGVLTVELHQALGLDWTTVASGRIALQPLLQQEGALQGSVELLGCAEEPRPFGSLQFWIKLRNPVDNRQDASGNFLSGPSEEAQLNELQVSVHRCSGLRSRSSRQPSPYVVYKFWDHPDHPTATVHDRGDPAFDDVRSYPVPMDARLHAHLLSERLHFYVFDFEEEQMDTYAGKVGVPLLPLLHDRSISGVFQLSDPGGVPAGQIQVTLRWKLAYVPPPHCGLQGAQLEEKAAWTREEVDQQLHPSTSCKPEAPAAACLPRVSLKSLLREAASTKKVTFREAADAQSEAPRSAADEDEDEESHVSEGQLLAASAQSASDDSEISEDIPEENVPAAAADQDESTPSDSDDLIVDTRSTARKASERLRVEIVSLSLSPDCRAARDDSVVLLFVEYCFLDLPTEETPLSLPKPPPGRSANYNYSKVIPVDAETNMARRRLLRGVLRGRNAAMERIQFTVVSEPPEEEEQERECENVGVASLRIAELLERRGDITDAKLDVVSLEHGGELVGSLTVSVEALEALQSIMEDEDSEDG